MPGHSPLEEFRLQSRDLYIPAGDIGMWQGALRNPDDPVREAVGRAIDSAQPVTVELLYSDLVGRQRTISRFGLFPASDMWMASLNRHWYLDWDGPRPERLALEAVEAVRRDQDAANDRRTRTANEEAAPGEAGDGDHEDPLGVEWADSTGA